jgi:hypothetical protein
MHSATTFCVTIIDVTAVCALPLQYAAVMYSTTVCVSVTLKVLDIQAYM